jgi:class 3 adenylate cyclase
MEAPPLERKLVAILAADVAGYSRLMGIDEEGTLATLSELRSITDDLISEHGGKICGTAGDSVLAAFTSALAAVQCAVDIQTEIALANDSLELDRRMHFRIGINVGDVMVKDGDIFGDGVNIAARLEGLAEPGGICISRGIHDHVMKKLPFDFEDLGEQSVKNIAQPVRVFRVILSGRMAAFQSSPSPPAPPDAEIDLPSLSEGDTIAPSVEERGVEIEFWDSIKNSTRADEYKAYLERYPEGNFAALARLRLESIANDPAAMRDPQEREIELAFWQSVRESDNPELIRAYLKKYPDGEFRALAEIQIGGLAITQPSGRTSV